MTQDKPEIQPLSKPWRLVTYGLALKILYLCLAAIPVKCLLLGPGSYLTVERARQVVASRGDLLAEALELSQRRPLPDRDSAECRRLAAKFGAIDIRFDVRPPSKESMVVIAFSRRGIGETYETQLTWAPAGVAELVRAGKDRLGEYFEYIDHGWWWVFW